jgi:UDP-N-acetylglucosamine 4,6-dehydratase
MYDGKTVLVTGGAGSFGTQYVRHLLKHPVRKVIVYSRDEFKQWNMKRAITDPRVRYFIGDIRDRRRLNHALQTVDVVVHAAALKHVVAMEYNPEEAVKTNIGGSQNVVDAILDSPVWQAILLSTDKACEPVNLYGATKMVAERLWISSNVHKSCFSFVRYGNVMESRGGVLGIWQDALARGESELTITDSRMTRFWMTYPRAIGCVDAALGFPPGLGVIGKAPRFSLITLAWTLAGKEQRVIRVTEIGRWPGEKLYETLVTQYEGERCRDAGEHYILPPENVFDDNLVYPAWPGVETGFSYESGQGEGMTPEEIGGLICPA